MFNDIFMVSHFETEGPLSYRQLRNYANRRNIHDRQIRHLRDRLNPLEEYDDEDFRLRFRLTKDSVSDLVCPNKKNTMAFVNRKQFHSINVQAVCDSDAFITNIEPAGLDRLATHAVLRTARWQTN